MRSNLARRLRRLVSLVAAMTLAYAISSHASGVAPSSLPTLVVDNSFALDAIDPQHAFDPTSSIVDRAIYDTLFTYKGNDLAHPVPLLVRSWRDTEAKIYTFQLRRDVHFADGAPLTSADVVFSLRRLINLEGNPAFLLSGARISARGEYTVVVATPTPEVQLPSILANPSTGIVNSKLVRAHGGTDAVNASTADTAEAWLSSPASSGAGSGPYELESYAPESQVVLRANPDYWGSKRPGFGTVVVRNMPAPAQLLNIPRGPHQIAIDLSSDQAQTLRGDKSLDVSLRPSPWVFYLFTNDDPKLSAVTSNKDFQLAVRDALDYPEIASLAGSGAIQAPGMVPSMILGTLPRKDRVREDLARARGELAASGVGNKQVTLEYPSDVTINGVSLSTLAQKVQSELNAVGFNIALSGLPVATFQPQFRSGQVAFGLWTWAPDFPDPADYLVFTPGGLVALHAGWQAGSDLAVERLARRAQLATSASARGSLYRRIQLGLNMGGPFIPLIQPAQAFVATSDLAGAAFSGAYDVDLTQVTPK